jgi:hypothetical protein
MQIPRIPPLLAADEVADHASQGLDLGVGELGAHAGTVHRAGTPA